MANITIKGLKELKARLAKIGPEAKRTIQAALDKGADEMVSRSQVVCPENDLDPHPGDLRRSIHKEQGTRDLIAKRGSKDVLEHNVERGLSVQIVADAKDAKGNEYGLHVELGHKTPSGGHVAGNPFFFTTWRVIRKRCRNRVKRAVSAAVKGQAASGE